MRWPGARGGERGEAATELGRLVTADGDVEGGQLVRALSRAVVHVPMPDTPDEPHPRYAAAADGPPPLYVIEDDGGRHALVYSSPRAFLDAWSARGVTTAAAVAMPTLLAGWPAGTDLVIDAGLPHARQVPVAVLQQVALDAAGVPTVPAMTPSPSGWDVEIPDPEPVQVIGATRSVADDTGDLIALWRGVTRDHEPLSRPVLNVVARFQPGTPRERVTEVMRALTAAIGEVDPQPVRMVADTGEPSNARQLIDELTSLDEPYWTRAGR